MPLNQTNGYLRVSTLTSGTISGDSSHVQLVAVLVNVAGAAANRLTLRQGSATGAIVAVIDTVALRELDFHALRFQDGIHYDLATGTPADVTILYE